MPGGFDGKGWRFKIGIPERLLRDLRPYPAGLASPRLMMRRVELRLISGLLKGRNRCVALPGSLDD
jgi:hypothetical protein